MQNLGDTFCPEDCSTRSLRSRQPTGQAVEREESQNERETGVPYRDPPASDLLALDPLVLSLFLSFGCLPLRAFPKTYAKGTKLRGSAKNKTHRQGTPLFAISFPLFAHRSSGVLLRSPAFSLTCQIFAWKRKEKKRLLRRLFSTLHSDSLISDICLICWEVLIAPWPIWEGQSCITNEILKLHFNEFRFICSSCTQPVASNSRDRVTRDASRTLCFG